MDVLRPTLKRAPYVVVAAPAIVLTALYDIIALPFEGRFKATAKTVASASHSAIPDYVLLLHFPSKTIRSETEMGSPESYWVINEAFLLSGRFREAPSREKWSESEFRFKGGDSINPDLKFVVLGTGLHTLQDSCSHHSCTGIGGIWPIPSMTIQVGIP